MNDDPTSKGESLEEFGFDPEEADDAISPEKLASIFELTSATMKVSSNYFDMIGVYKIL